MEPPSSTSSSDARPSGVRIRPRVTRAGWIALAVALAGGAALRAVAVPAPGMPPLAAFSGLDAEAYRYRAATGSAGYEILLLGSSLIRYAVEEGTLTADLAEIAEIADPARGDTLVFNAALDGGRLWDVLRLVDAMPPSRAAKRRLAVLEVNRVSAETALLDHPYAAARASRRSPPPPSPRATFEALWAQVPPRQDAVTWAQQAVYGSLALHAPALVPVPHALPRTLWIMNDAQRARAVADKDPRAMGEGMHGTVRETPEALKLLVAALHDHGFQVLLLQTPLHGEMLAAMAEAPDSDQRARVYRAAALGLTATGADEVLAFDRMSEIGGDDSMLADYGHLLPAGSRLLTRRLAEYLRESALWGGGGWRR